MRTWFTRPRPPEPDHSWPGGYQVAPDDPMAREREKDQQALELYACWQEEQLKAQAMQQAIDDMDRELPK